MSDNTDTTPAAEGARDSRIIVDIGKRKKSLVKALRSGEGELMEEVEQCLQDLRASGRIDATAQPVILIVRQKAKAARRCPLCTVAGKMM